MRLRDQTLGQHVALDRVPYVVVWELTRPTDPHRPAPYRDGPTLSSGNALRLLEQVVELAPRRVVLTGDDLLACEDAWRIIERAVDGGLALTVEPRGAGELPAATMARLARAGVRRIGLAVEGPAAAVPDGRGVPVSWGRARATAAAARAAGQAVEVDSSVAAMDVPHLGALAGVVRAIAPVCWRVGVHVPGWREGREATVAPDAAEAMFHLLYEWSNDTGVAVDTRAAPAFRRVVRQRDASRRAAGEHVARRRLLPVNDGKGLVFVSHAGRVLPSPDLPLGAGTVADAPLGAIYRRSRLFRLLRATWRLEGRCGVCPFNALCGGSRARAFAATGNLLAEDPACAYLPPAWPALRATA